MTSGVDPTGTFVDLLGTSDPEEIKQLHLQMFELAHAKFDVGRFKKKEKTRQEKFAIAWAYYDGKHRKHLKVRKSEGDHDDNVTVNLCSVLIDRTVARLFGDMVSGSQVSFDIERKEDLATRDAEEAEGRKPTKKQIEQAEINAHAYLNEMWKRSGSLYSTLSKVGEYGSVTGHFFMKIVLPTEEEAKIVVLDSSLVSMLSVPDDKDRRIAYKIQYVLKGFDPKDNPKTVKDIDFRQVILHGPDFKGPEGWYVQDFINYRRKGESFPEWEPQTPIERWEFCPIYENQNLPHAREMWGKSDLNDVVDLNDEVNFILSNVNRIVRYQIPRTIGIGVEADSIQKTAIDSFWTVPATPDQADIFNLEMKSDLRAVYQFFELIREAFWTIGREADPATFKEKIGNVTNFGLRVLYLDALNKLGQKRDSYGKALKQILDQMLIIGGFDGYEVRLNWADPLPSDPREEVETMMLEMDMGILSPETAAKERGRNYATEKERIQESRKDMESMGVQLMRQMGMQTGTPKPSTDKRNLNAS